MKKILLIIALIFVIFQMVVLATAIDIGSAATDRNSKADKYTLIDKANPADYTGKINSVEIWANEDMTNVEVATFYVVSGNNLSTRDSEAISGTITAGSKVTKTVDLDVVAGDYIGIHYSGAYGYIEASDSGGTALWYRTDDSIPCTNAAFTYLANYAISLYGTGATAGIKWNTVTISKWNGQIITKLNGMQ